MSVSTMPVSAIDRGGPAAASVIDYSPIEAIRKIGIGGLRTGAQGVGRRWIEYTESRDPLSDAFTDPPAVPLGSAA